MLTEIEIINAMLASTGTAPLTSNDTSHPFYIKARNKLTYVNRQIQAKGWWFNRTHITLPPNVSGEVILPSNTLHADPVDTTLDLVVRAGKLYDLANRTHVISKDVEIVFVELVDIEDLPPTVGEYLMARAVYEFYRDEDGNQPKLGTYNQARIDAFVLFKGEHLRNADVNYFRGTSHAQISRGVRGRRFPPYHR